MAGTRQPDSEPTIIDVLLGRHRHTPLITVTEGQRLYGNYWLDEPSKVAELATGGRQRNRPMFDDGSNEVAQTVRRRGY
jgi:hypothetical protein